MNSFLILVVMAAVVWLAGLVCAALAIALGLRATSRRFWASVVLSIVALGIGCLGLQSHITYSQTVNGRGWSLDSRWFFIAPVILGALALALALWNRMRNNSLPKV